MASDLPNLQLAGIGSPAFPPTPCRGGRDGLRPPRPFKSVGVTGRSSGIEHQRYKPFALSAARSDGEATLAVAGELDLESADKLKHGVSELRLPEIKEIVLDLHRVDFIDSSGLRALLVLRDDAEGNGHALTLVPPPPSARRVFEITGTWDMFEWRGARATP